MDRQPGGRSSPRPRSWDQLWASWEKHMMLGAGDACFCDPLALTWGMSLSATSYNAEELIPLGEVTYFLRCVQQGWVT